MTPTPTVSFLNDLRARESVISVELRPPRAELESNAGIDAWIDLYHSIRSLTRLDVRVMLTDSAVGAQEENNLRHLVANLGEAVARTRVVPFLTSKHSMEFCLAYADQTVEHGFPSLVVLGGDKHVGRPRVVEHAWQLRQRIRERHPGLELGGWANPVAGPAQQMRFLLDPEVNADFFLTQIVSHHQAAEVAAFMDEGVRARTGDAGRVRRLLLPQREREDAAHAESVPAGAGGRPAARVRRGRDPGGHLRAHHPRAALARGAALLSSATSRTRTRPAC